MADIKKWTNSLKTEWITDGITKETVVWAEDFGHYLADGIKRTENDLPIQAKNRDGSLKTKFNKITNKQEPDWEKQNPLTTSQLRKFFGEIRRMQAEIQHQKVDSTDKQKFDKTSLLMLKPKLAYQVGREKDSNGKVRDFYSQLSIGVDAVQTREDFKKFVKIVEAVVAYHKEKESEKPEVRADNEN